MLLRSATSLGTSLAISLMFMPVLMASGKRLGLVSKPRLFGQCEKTIPNVGGLAIAMGAGIGFSVAWGLPVGVGALATGALLSIGLGCADDRFGLLSTRPACRLFVQILIAVGAWAAGLRADQPGLIGAVGSVLFLVACMNAMNLLDNMDGVAATTALASGAGITALALLNGQFMVASLSASLCGACLGFLPFNFKDARAYLGNGGSLLIGFLLGGAALKLRLPVEYPWGLVALGTLMAVPITDTTLVMISRFMHGRPIMLGSVDHISHRLVKSGLGTRETALVHGALAVFGAGAVAIAVESGFMQVLVAEIAIFGLLGTMLLRVPVYERSKVSGRKVALVGASALASLIMLAIAATPVFAGLR